MISKQPATTTIKCNNFVKTKQQQKSTTQINDSNIFVNKTANT